MKLIYGCLCTRMLGRGLWLKTITSAFSAVSKLFEKLVTGLLIIQRYMALFPLWFKVFSFNWTSFDSSIWKGFAHIWVHLSCSTWYIQEVWHGLESWFSSQTQIYGISGLEIRFSFFYNRIYTILNGRSWVPHQCWFSSRVHS